MSFHPEAMPNWKDDGSGRKICPKCGSHGAASWQKDEVESGVATLYLNAEYKCLACRCIFHHVSMIEEYPCGTYVDENEQEKKEE